MEYPTKHKATRLDYCQYLLSSQINYTLTNFAEHVQTISHDTINRYLRDDKLTPRLLWEHTQEKIILSEQGYIVFDDSILDKNYSKNIEAVRWQYSGNAHRIIRGIGLVNCIYINPETNQYWAINYRVFSPDTDGKSKMEHVQDMLTNVLEHKKIPFKSDDTRKVCAIRWYIEQFHRELKQLTGIEQCKCKKARIQRNHIVCAMLVWARMKQKAYELHQTVYQIKSQLLKNYLINELRSPTLSMSFA